MGVDIYIGMVVLDTPAHDKASACVVEVSFDNGQTYTASGNVYTFYQDPSITTITPSCRIVTGEALHCLEGPGLEAAGRFTRVRFTPEAVEGQEPCASVVALGEWNDERRGVLCKSPPFPRGYVTVEVALNGQQFSEHTSKLLYFEPPQVRSLKPDACELGQVPSLKGGRMWRMRCGASVCGIPSSCIFL